MRLNRTCFFALAPLLFVGCTSRSPIDLEAARTSLETAVEQYHSAMLELNPQAAAGLYDESVFMIPKGKDMLKSSISAENYLVGTARTPGFSPHFETLAVHLSESGTTGYSVALVHVNFDGPDGETMTDATRDVHFWQKDASGDWKIILDVWNAAPEPTN